WRVRPAHFSVRGCPAAYADAGRPCSGWERHLSGTEDAVRVAATTSDERDAEGAAESFAQQNMDSREQFNTQTGCRQASQASTNHVELHLYNLRNSVRPQRAAA